MNQIEKFKNNDKEYIEPEILDNNYKENKKENIFYSYTNNDFKGNLKGFSKIIFKAKKTFLISSFTLASIFIILGVILSLTFIGAIIGVPLIIIGFIIIFITIKIIH